MGGAVRYITSQPLPRQLDGGGEGRDEVAQWDRLLVGWPGYRQLLATVPPIWHGTACSTDLRIRLVDCRAWYSTIPERADEAHKLVKLHEVRFGHSDGAVQLPMARSKGLQPPRSADLRG